MGLHTVEITPGDGFEYLLEAFIEPKWVAVNDLHLYVVGESTVDKRTGLTKENKIEITDILTKAQRQEYAEIALEDWRYQRLSAGSDW